MEDFAFKPQPIFPRLQASVGRSAPD